MIKKIFVLIFFLGITISCGYGDNSVVGTWRNLSNQRSTMRLVLNSSGTWKFGSSSGKWDVSSIEASDWTGWGIHSYGPTRKLILNGWNKTGSKGPIEESKGTINYIWVIYNYTDRDSGVRSIVHIKFGRV